MSIPRRWRYVQVSVLVLSVSRGKCRGRIQEKGYGEALMLIIVRQTVVKELRKDAEEVRAELEMAERQ